MSESFLGSQIRRAGDILKDGVSGQISEYGRKFEAVHGLYDGFLSNLMVSDFSLKKAYRTAVDLFGSDEVGFAGVDGTECSRPLFDMVVFFGGAYASKGRIKFHEDMPPTVEYAERFLEEGRGVSSCVPIYVNEVAEVDQAFMELGEPGQVSLTKPLTDEAIINNSEIALWMMLFSEYYLAYKLASEGETKIILLDRSLSNTQSSLIYDTSRRKLWKSNGTIHGYEIDGEPIDMNDLAYGRHRIVSRDLSLPPPRGDYVRYRIISLLEEAEEPLTLDQILKELNVREEDRQTRFERYLKKCAAEDFAVEANGTYRLNPKYKTTWQRLKKLVRMVGHQLFEEKSGGNPMKLKKGGEYHWLTTQDFAFLTLFCLNMLVEECWRRSILLVGMTKDTAARDFKNHLIPVCLNEKIWDYPLVQEQLSRAPNTDRMLLQSISLFNHEKVKVPWGLIEYDSAFKLIVPDFERRRGYVSGAVRNKIIPERLFVKSYIQLSQAEFDPKLRSNVLFMDRLVYPKFDLRQDTVVRFRHEYGGAVEPVEAIMFRDRNVPNPVQNLVMVTLKAMTSPSIPEVFGHNKPLFIADKVAKWHYGEAARLIDTMGEWIINNRSLRDFVFYMSTFRERRAQIELTRRETV
jgi:hypothetical protein